jgi:acyl-CoA synthetase (AMP-forming)/AMP-acid ligase II
MRSKSQNPRSTPYNTEILNPRSKTKIRNPKSEIRNPMSLYETLARSAAQHADRPAVIDAAGTLDYAALWHAVEAMRAVLAGRGIAPGLGVGVRGRDGRDFIVAVLGALGCGAVVVPLSPQMRGEDLAELVARTRLHALLDDGAGEPPPAQAASQFDGSAAPAGAGAPPPALLACVSEDLAVPAGATMHFLRTAVPAERRFAADFPDAAFVRFTSGTTGPPKGVVLSDDSILGRTAAANAGLCIGPGDTILWLQPMAFHLFVSIMLYLRFGATILVPDEKTARSPKALLALAARHQPTLLYAGPGTYRDLAADESDARLPGSVRLAISTGTALPADTARNFEQRHGLAPSQAYGIIEVGLPLVNTDGPSQHPESVGRALPDYEVALLDPAGRPVASGEMGELVVRGPGMLAGYLDPPTPREVLLHDGWFATGDLARCDAHSYVTVLGRAQSALVVGGRHVFPEEVEAVLERHPLVARCRVSGRAGGVLGQAVHADVVARDPASPPDPDVLRAFCRQHLAAYAVPRTLTFVPELRETLSGKIARG